MGSKKKKKEDEKSVTPPDIARLGIFREEPYIFINQPYIPLDTLVWNEAAHKRKQMVIKVSGRKDGTNDGYFEKFERGFEGEALNDPLKLYRQERTNKKKKFYAGEFIMPSPGKKIFGRNHYWGTFWGPIPRLNPAVRPKKPPERLKNVKIKPPKKGSGYGEVDCTISVPYEAMDPWEPKIKTTEKFDDPEQPLFYSNAKYPNFINQNPFYTSVPSIPEEELRPVSGKLRLAMLSSGRFFHTAGKGKTIGGNKDGCFTKFKQFSTYVAYKQPPRKVETAPFITKGSRVSTFRSTVEANVHKRVTPLTYKTIDGVMYLNPKNEIKK